MKRVILGPTMSVRLPGPPGPAVERLDAWLAGPGCPFAGTRVGRHFQIAVPPARRRLWSAHLTLEAAGLDAHGQRIAHASDDAAAEADATEIYGRFNPSPGLWTGFMLASLALLTVMFMGAMWAWAQTAMDQPPTALVTAPVCAVFIALLWTLNGVGQHLARHEIAAMQEAVEDALAPLREPTAAGTTRSHPAANAVETPARDTLTA